MRLNARLFGYAAALVAAMVYFVCGFFAAVGRGATQGFFSYVLHVNLVGLVRPITVISFALGLILFSAMVGGSAWLTARVYNALGARAAAQAAPRPSASLA